MVFYHWVEYRDEASYLDIPCPLWQTGWGLVLACELLLILAGLRLTEQNFLLYLFIYLFIFANISIDLEYLPLLGRLAHAF